MRGINKVILVGNLGADPEVKYLPSGNAVANLSLATDESYKNKDGQKVDKTEWHRVVIFGKIAEIAAQYLKKGSKVYIEGKIQTRKWQDQSGQDKYSTEIVVDINGQMQMLDSRDGQQGAQSYQQQQQQPQRGSYADAKAGVNQRQPAAPAEDFDDDIPF